MSMTDDELTDLRSLNEARASAGDRTAALTVRLVEAYHETRAQLMAARELVQGMARRCAEQSELLSRRAKK
jgi:hypothetical protein